MTEQLASGDLTDAVARAVLGTPGVAFLRPGVAQLLRASRALARVRPTGDRLGRPPRSSGVRVTRGEGAERWHVEVYVVLHRGHRAVDVTREVRAAVADAVRTVAGVRDPRVSVTVTGLV
ncbi:Asp23/Gls24 family envelope stress response protein [Streptomyces sp. BG9H]|uniref:Asp23/Gls24 family envelope stress response protein n=1 Tax=Streptomyces anatolicus TaxID=2675858 RepID=A0ABS6YQ30_9ACTN|nr:Asp23/Gls24 family envelope stress response protein [Streptomyces anatolicus]MBW5423472.1 Asp23/Gls24 family envelope stress response protein [Streptomyces anatolicus]